MSLDNTHRSTSKLNGLESHPSVLRWHSLHHVEGHRLNRARPLLYAVQIYAEFRGWILAAEAAVLCFRASRRQKRWGVRGRKVQDFLTATSCGVPRMMNRWSMLPRIEARASFVAEGAGIENVNKVAGK